MAEPTKAELQAENDRLREQADAQAVQQDQMLDLMAEMKTRLEAIESSGGAVTQAVQQVTKQDQTAAEWEALREEFKDYPAIDMVERVVLDGNDADDGIRLRDEPGLFEDAKGERRKWKLRWFNFGVEGRAWMAQRKGYVKVQWDELRDEDARLTGIERKDVYVRRGDRGLEVLCKMPLKVFTFRKRVEAERMQGVLTSETKLRDHISSGVAAKAGNMGDNADQAGSFAHSGMSVSITNPGEVERVTI